MGTHRRRPEEDAARAVIKGTLGLPVELNDTCKAQSAWDFTIDPDGEPQALEVVRCVDLKSKKNAAAAHRHTGNGIRIDGLRRMWQIQINDERHPIYSQLKKKLPAPLLAAEAAGLSEVEAYDRWSIDKPTVQPIATALAQLRIERAWRSTPAAPKTRGWWAWPTHSASAQHWVPSPDSRSWRSTSTARTPPMSARSSQAADVPGAMPSSGSR